MSTSGWIGVDLDGTVARYDHWIDELTIGEPIDLMVQRVRNWLAQGITVKIVTARVSSGAKKNLDGTPRDVAAVVSAIQDWTEQHVGARLDVTAEKDFGMVELWDDRAVTVEHNTGVALARPRG